MPSFKPPTLLLSICIAFLVLARAHARVLASPYTDLGKRISVVPNPPPTFRVYEANPDFPDPRVADGRLRQAWVDMWYMAAVACHTLDEQEDVYQRYFEAGESEMVRYIFCNIAGIEDYTACDLSQQEPTANIHMQDLTIIAGMAQPNEVPPDEQPDLSDEDLDIFCTTFQDLGANDEKAYTQFYKRSFDFPTLYDIFTKRTCSGLGQYDSGLMTSLGAHMLHEMIHWRILVRGENNQERFDVVIPHVIWILDSNPDSDPENEEEDVYAEEEQDYITDYNKYELQNPPVNPTTGYGPTNAHSLMLNGNRASFQNADNYRWYAVSRYWSWKCTQANGGIRVVFGAQNNKDLDDSMIPEGCDGQVPCPRLLV